MVAVLPVSPHATRLGQAVGTYCTPSPTDKVRRQAALRELATVRDEAATELASGAGMVATRTAHAMQRLRDEAPTDRLLAAVSAPAETRLHHAQMLADAGDLDGLGAFLAVAPHDVAMQALAADTLDRSARSFIAREAARLVPVLREVWRVMQGLGHEPGGPVTYAPKGLPQVLADLFDV